MIVAFEQSPMDVSGTASCRIVAPWYKGGRAIIVTALVLMFAVTSAGVADELQARAIPPALTHSVTLKDDVMPLLKRHCLKCHGVSKKEGQLQLHSAVRIWKGGESGHAVVAGHSDQSLLWSRVNANEMPPENPLNAEEKALLRNWIDQGAAGLPTDSAQADAMLRDEHWAFTRLNPISPPDVSNAEICQTPIDHFIVKELQHNGLTLSPQADRRTLIRRVAFSLTGLPPTVSEIEQFVNDTSDDAFDRMMDRYLASEQYGVRWGRHWLDAAGYADSNGYFNADSDRPLAYQYRDYVVRSLNADKPFDQFVREQIAGDELSGFQPEQHRHRATPEMIDMLIATHYLRNGQDGSGESDGNPDEVRIDRYTALESSQQIVASSLLGLTFQCAKCHDHKFEPLTQADYYQFQSVLFPAYNPNHWVKPNERVTYASANDVYEQWQSQLSDARSRLTNLKKELRQWTSDNRLPELIRFEDDFSSSELLDANWSGQIPGDDGPAGVTAVALLTNGADDSEKRPAAQVADGRLKIIEGGRPGDKWLSTKQIFDWTPDAEGQWIQVSFKLADTQVFDDQPSAERIAYGIALHDFDNNSAVPGGNVLIDGNPAGGATVHVDYPGDSSKHAGQIGSAAYEAGKSYGVRITRLADQKFRLQHLVDGLPEGGSVDLTAADLPDGSFGFGYCCGRSFQVDSIVFDASFAATDDGSINETVKEHLAELTRREQAIQAVSQEIPQLERQEPGRIAWVTDSTPEPPDVFLLDRGEYNYPKDKVFPAAVSVLNDDDNPFKVSPPTNGVQTSGRRLAWAKWVTHPNSRAASLMARVQVNRVWQQHFGTGIVSTPENLGMSGSEPSNAALLDWLAAEWIRSGWSLKSLHRIILRSAVFQQSSLANEPGLRRDPSNKYLWRYPMRRLDAEALRDAQLAISGDLDLTLEGPYIPTTRNGAAEVIVPEDRPGAFRRSIFLQQRRSQGLSLLNVFDAPMMVVNCTRRPVTTMPLQSLALLNSDFAVNRGRSFAQRIKREAGDADHDRIQLAFVLATAQPATEDDVNAAAAFIENQRQLYAVTEADNTAADNRAWSDFCQLLLAGNACLYLE